MCGFTGYFSPIRLDQSQSSQQIIQNMTNCIVHRGPDSEGFWSDSLERIVMGFRRLAILDISENGNQPMISNSGQHVIVFNGEIYNHLELRKAMQIEKPSINWLSSSDTETLLAGFDLWGIEKTIQNSTGMFSFAVWCNKDKVLTLGRDRLGEKPLYYGWQGKKGKRVFLFGSELKSFHKHPEFLKEINRDAVSTFLRYSYIPAPASIYNDIYKLLPGHLLRVSLEHQEPIITEYWSASKIAKQDMSLSFSSDLEATNALDLILQKSVKQQMISDVPLGGFLSGGIDSSLIASLMQSQSMEKIKTFTIGFNQKEFNEAHHAKAVARHLQTDHSELYIDSKDLLSVIPNLSHIYDEPFGDSSQIPTYLISKFARQNVTVALSGDGGDELFGGYNRYQITNQYWRILKNIPLSLRKLMSLGLLSLPPKKIERFHALLSNQNNYSNLADKVYKGANVLASKDIYSLYKGLVSAYPDPDSIVINGFESNKLFSSNQEKLKNSNDLSFMMLMDLLTYLPDDILTKVDRAAMGVSLETRVPMLDHNVVEFALRLPQKYKLRNNQTKWLLREVLYRNVPQELIERPKAGFAIPIGLWLRTNLKDWADDLLDEVTMNSHGFFNAAKVRERWHQHQSGSHNWEHFLWNILMFQSWFIDFHEKN
jgi:asparagine synthase (glutamine-hydrolysing)